MNKELRAEMSKQNFIVHNRIEGRTQKRENFQKK